MTSTAENQTPNYVDALRAESDTRLVQIWLASVAVLVAAIVIVGGATRLTDSGLSITEWNPITGIIPPLSAADWALEFEKYRQIPEYIEINRGMSLEEFKFIYWWEWGHRFLGRVIGFAFAIPFVLLLIGRKIPRILIPRLVLLFALGGLQGFIGWWMVASGLTERTDVSQYRLAVHLTLACVIFAVLLWTIFGLSPEKRRSEPQAVQRGAYLVIGLIFVQIVLGALVAGLDAGLTYNTWPLMDGDFVPGGLLALSPMWINITENITTVQFNHRMFAYLLTVVVLLHAWQLWRLDTGNARTRAALLVSALAAQVVIGIATLLYVVPLWLGLLHQFGALVLLGISVWSAQESRGEARLISA